MEVIVGREGQAPTIGHTALTYFDLVIDPAAATLIGNPAHGGEWMFETD